MPHVRHTTQVAIAPRKYPEDELKSLLDELSARLDRWTHGHGNLSDVVASHLQRISEHNERVAQHNSKVRLQFAEEEARRERCCAEQRKRDIVNERLAKDAKAKQREEEARAAAKVAADAAAAKTAAEQAEATQAAALLRAAAAEYASLVQVHQYTVDIAQLPPPLVDANNCDGRVELAEQLTLLLQQLLNEAASHSWASDHVYHTLSEAVLQQSVLHAVQSAGALVESLQVRCSACLRQENERGIGRRPPKACFPEQGRAFHTLMPRHKL